MSDQETRKTRVLIVDDVVNTLEVIQRNLSAWGYEVHPAGGVEEAISMLGRRTFDLVITDLKMPRLNGFHLIRHVQEIYPDTGIILITGYPDQGDEKTESHVSKMEFLTKPFTEEELHHSVQRALSKLNSAR